MSVSASGTKCMQLLTAHTVAEVLTTSVLLYCGQRCALVDKRCLVPSNGCSDSCPTLPCYQTEAKSESAPDPAAESALHPLGRLSLVLCFSLLMCSGKGLVCAAATWPGVPCSTLAVSHEHELAVQGLELETRVIFSYPPSLARFLGRAVVWPTVGGSRCTYSADGQLLDEDLIMCSELHDATGWSHFHSNVFDLEQFRAIWMRINVSNYLALLGGKPRGCRCKREVFLRWLRRVFVTRKVSANPSLVVLCNRRFFRGASMSKTNIRAHAQAPVHSRIENEVGTTVPS